MARPKGGIPWNKGLKMKQFCVNGHDTFVVGRKTNGECKECGRLRIIKWREENKEHIATYDVWYDSTHKEEIKASCKKWYENNKASANAKHKEWLAEHKEEVALTAKEYYETHKDEIYEKHKKWVADHPESIKASALKAHSNRGLRAPNWADWNTINKIINRCPTDLTVDHIIPLLGEGVSGLHVSWNLQYLTHRENAKKNNKCNLLEASEWYGKILQQAGLK
jgi:hypothetical protein